MPVKMKNVELNKYVSFLRKNNLYNGRVIEKRENTVMVELEPDAANKLGLENNLTVVNYKNCIGVFDEVLFY